MDLIIVFIIVAAAVGFTIRGFLKMYRGEGNCGCGNGCSCSDKDACGTEFPIVDKKR